MDNLLSQLRQLRLPAMVSALERQRETPGTYGDLAFEERLLLLVEQEHLSRGNNRITRLRKQANLRLQAQPEQLKYPAARGLRKEQLIPLLEALKLGHVDGSYLKILSKLQKVDLLILDDWGLEGFKGKQITDLLDVIEVLTQVIR